MCLTPNVHRVQHKKIPVSCGKCAECLEIQRMQWFTRLYMESRNSQRSQFITLTYADEPQSGVNKTDIQEFLKRLRHKNPIKVKYYLVSEYGDLHGRAHYHMLLFNYVAPIEKLREAWGHGHIHVGTVSPASINYCAKYHTLKGNAIEGRNKPFMQVSKGMGIGYVATNQQYHKQQMVGYVQIHEKKFPMPRYYKDKIFSDQEKQILSEQYDVSLRQMDQIKKIMLKSGSDFKTALFDWKERKQKKQLNFKRKITENSTL